MSHTFAIRGVYKEKKPQPGWQGVPRLYRLKPGSHCLYVVQKTACLQTRTRVTAKYVLRMPHVSKFKDKLGTRHSNHGFAATRSCLQTFFCMIDEPYDPGFSVFYTGVLRLKDATQIFRSQSI